MTASRLNLAASRNRFLKPMMPMASSVNVSRFLRELLGDGDLYLPGGLQVYGIQYLSRRGRRDRTRQRALQHAERHLPALDSQVLVIPVERIERAGLRPRRRGADEGDAV